VAGRPEPEPDHAPAAAAPLRGDGPAWLRRARAAGAVARPLVPARLRRAAGVLLAVCVTLVTALGVLAAGHSTPDRFDAAVDTTIRSGIGAHVTLLEFLSRFGDLPLVTAMTAALVLGCAAAGRWRGAVLAAVAVPVASGLTELVLKHVIGRTLRGWLSYPSGHAACTFALAMTATILLAGPARPGLRASGPRLPAVVRRLLMVGAFLAAAVVSVGVVGLDLHYFTDIVAGAALGTGTVLGVALLLDAVETSRRSRSRSRSRSRPGASLSPPAEPGSVLSEYD